MALFRTALAQFARLDADKDGVLTAAEVARGPIAYVKPPDLTYSDRLDINLGGKRVEVISRPIAHADDNTIAVVPGERPDEGPATLPRPICCPARRLTCLTTRPYTRPLAARFAPAEEWRDSPGPTAIFLNPLTLRIRRL